MADYFVQLPVETDTHTLADNAVDNLRTRWPDWNPDEGDLGVVQIEALAPMASDASETQSRVSRALFRAFGTKLHGIPYRQGTHATTTAIFAVTPSDVTRVLPAFTELVIDSYAFATIDPITVPAGATSVSGRVDAVDPGASRNGLPGDSVAMLTSVSYITGVSTTGPTADGSDPDTDDSYQEDLTRQLQLSAKTLVTPRDFELMGLSEPGVARIVAVSDPANRTMIVTGADENGEALSTVVKDRLAALYEQYRQSTWILTVTDATYTTVSVSYSVHPYTLPGFDSSDLISRINSTLESWLSPKSFGAPDTFGDPGSGYGFTNENTVRRNKLIRLIGDVDGVDYVDAVHITGSAGTLLDGDLVLPGVVSLPKPGFMSGTTV